MILVSAKANDETDMTKLTEVPYPNDMMKKASNKMRQIVIN